MHDRAAGVPPMDTISAPLLPGTPKLVLLTMVLIARPPDETISRPVLDKVAPETTPPPETISRRRDVPAAADVRRRAALRCRQTYGRRY